MNIVEAMERRHAVRDFSDRPIDDDTLRALNEAVDAANADGGLDVQLVQDDTDAFGGCPTHYGRFKNVRYCIVLIGSDDEDPAQLDRKVGYYGERLALTATQLGMGSSWVVLHETHDHDGRWRLGEGERMPAALALGYGNRPGRAHRSKPLEELGAVENGDLFGAPDWFLSGFARWRWLRAHWVSSRCASPCWRTARRFSRSLWRAFRPISAWASHGIISRSAPAILISSSADSTGPAWPFSRISRTIVQIQL